MWKLYTQRKNTYFIYRIKYYIDLNDTQNNPKTGPKAEQTVILTLTVKKANHLGKNNHPNSFQVWVPLTHLHPLSRKMPNASSRDLDKQLIEKMLESLSRAWG